MFDEPSTIALMAFGFRGFVCFAEHVCEDSVVEQLGFAESLLVRAGKSEVSAPFVAEGLLARTVFSRTVSVPSTDTTALLGEIAASRFGATKPRKVIYLGIKKLWPC